MSALEQGDIIQVDFNPAVGHEPAKLRPALVVTVFGFNCRSSLVGVIPITSTDNGYPLHVPVRGQGAGGFACIEQLRTIDLSARGYEVLGYASEVTMGQVMAIIRGMFALR